MDKIKEHNVVRLKKGVDTQVAKGTAGTVVHIYKGTGMCEVELRTTIQVPVKQLTLLCSDA